MPATVLAAHIDCLPLEEKRRLQTAAAIGYKVPFALLRAIADVPEETLRRGLRRFSGHGLTHGRTELALVVLVHHLLVLPRCSSQKYNGNRPRRRLKREQPKTGRSVEAVEYPLGSI